MPRVHKKKVASQTRYEKKKSPETSFMITCWVCYCVSTLKKMALPSQIYSDAKNEDVTFAPRIYEKVYSSYSELSGESRMALREIQKCLKRVR